MTVRTAASGLHSLWQRPSDSPETKFFKLTGSNIFYISIQINHQPDTIFQFIF